MEINEKNIETLILTIKARIEREKKVKQYSYFSENGDFELITTRSAPLIRYFSPNDASEYDAYGSPKK